MALTYLGVAFFGLGKINDPTGREDQFGDALTLPHDLDDFFGRYGRRHLRIYTNFHLPHLFIALHGTHCPVEVLGNWNAWGAV